MSNYLMSFAMSGGSLWDIHTFTRVTGMTHFYVWHDSYIGVTWNIHMWDMMHSYVRHDAFMWFHICDMTHWYVWHHSFECVACYIHMCNMTHSYVLATSFCVWHDSFIRVTWEMPLETCRTPYLSVANDVVKKKSHIWTSHSHMQKRQVTHMNGSSTHTQTSSHTHANTRCLWRERVCVLRTRVCLCLARAAEITRNNSREWKKWRERQRSRETVLQSSRDDTRGRDNARERRRQGGERQK